ncbi:MAG: hypothetical protein AB7U75_05965 [Hyphomicrobiaceae bacterium]
MTRNPLAHALRPHRGAPLANAQGDAPPTTCEPMDENALASEIARIMERRSAPRQIYCAENSRWLGEEADRAIVDAYVATPAPARNVEGSDNAASPAALRIDTDASATENEPPAIYDAGTAARWVRQARRDRFRTKVRDAAGWTVSVCVSLLIVAVVGLAMYGWPDGSATVRPIEMKSLKVSTIARPPGRPAPASPSGAATLQSQFVTAETDPAR